MASSGLSFALGGNKRPPSVKPTYQPKKPATVGDLFAEESDEDDTQVAQAKKARVAPAAGGAVPAPADPEVKRAADKLAEFVAKNGRNFEDVTKERNSGDTPFKFLFDKSSADYAYYEWKIKAFQQTSQNLPAVEQGRPGTSLSFATSNSDSAQLHAQSLSRGPSGTGFGSSAHRPLEEPEKRYAKAALAAGDSLAAMNAYMQLAAKKDKPPPEEEGGQRVPLLNDTAFERRKVAAVFRGDGSRGHHMQDFIPPEELAKFMAKTGDQQAAEQVKTFQQQAAIPADNIGHKLLQKMGWREGEGIGATGAGITAPVEAGGIKQDNLGLGAASVHEVEEGDDAFEQYRKRMMLGYKFRPNPLGNPRKPYY